MVGPVTSLEPGVDDKRDWRISAILLAVWAVAVYWVTSRRSDIPVSMIAIATVFFIVLIPAMNDLVRSIERKLLGERHE